LQWLMGHALSGRVETGKIPLKAGGRRIDHGE
jgi:hypothetical protein